ncbi:hypothetical protein SPONN_2670 [uncultured Candidatus Thioglobus sp.]|nr:hypothetical protein SPONN_2670 [uncultured Candidatus Thioglobus sp.]
MKIVPHQPYETNSKAEYRVFSKLKESLVNNNKYIAFHSLNLTKHEYKRFGEADFVIICEYGLFVFEVKGGSISCDNGIWHTINRDKEKHKIQNPFTQAETALHAIKKKMEESNKFCNLNIPIGYGVIFPDVKWTQQSSEWDKLIICDSQTFKNFENFLNKFFKYWHNKKANNTQISVENIKAIAQYLRPNFEVIESLSNQLLQQKENTLKLTQDQYRYLDIVASNPRVLCSGGAGTGKTFLAAELARRIARENKKVVFVCKSEWLKHYLSSKIINEFVTISTINSAKVDMKRQGIEKYEVLIVDEGQDLFNVSDIDKLNKLIVGKIEEGEWYIFHDINNQALGIIDDEAFEFLNSIPHTKIPLTTNCRNTNPILKYVQNLLDVDMGTKDIMDGPKVVEILDSSRDNTLEYQINTLLKDGIPSSHITLLSNLRYQDSSVSMLSSSLQDKIIELDSYSVRNFPVNKISFAQIKNFKGLENEVIILIDMPKPNKNNNKALYYVAMSRAKALLNIIYTD